jgi:Rieske 2Fe-2S family protein
VTAAGTIRCPYHLWTYSLDGELLSAPHLREADGLDKKDFSLYPVGIESWGGFFFLNLTPDEAARTGHSLARQLGPIPERVKRYPLAELRSARKLTYEVAANWKVIMENYNECYHCAGVHPELCEVVPAFRENGGAHLDWDQGIDHREGAFTFTRSGTTNRAPFATLSEEEKTRHKGELIYPNFMLSLSPEHAAAFQLWPLSAERTRVDCDFLFHPSEMAKPGFDPEDAVEFWDLINRQDWAICERVQLGMRCRVHRFGYYAPMEDLSLDIRRYVRERLPE